MMFPITINHIRDDKIQVATMDNIELGSVIRIPDPDGSIAQFNDALIIAKTTTGWKCVRPFAHLSENGGFEISTEVSMINEQSVRDGKVLIVNKDVLPVPTVYRGG